MRIRYLLFVPLLWLSAAASAYGHRTPVHPTDTVAPFVRAYVDSLQHYKLCLDSVLTSDSVRLFSNVDISDGRYSPLFLPLTFYHGISQRKFALESSEAWSSFSQVMDNALLHVYLSRPDLVTNTQSRLAGVPMVLPEQPKPIKNKTSIVDKVDLAPDEPHTEPVTVMLRRPNFWKFSGDSYLQFIQNYVSGNWYKGGESNYSMLGRLNFSANYDNHQKLKWDNRLEMQLGFQTTKSDTLRRLKTSTDLLRYTGKLGVQAHKNWYYTFQLIATTQFLRGYRNNDTKVYSDFLSPLNLNASIGMDYHLNWLKGKLTGTVHLAPLAYNYKYVGRENLATSYGIKKGDRHIDDYGSEVNINFNWRFSNMVRWSSRIYGYTSYKRSEVECENTITFQLTRFLSSNLYFYPRFDDSRSRDSHHGYWEFKEYLSFGFNYNF